MLRSSNSQKSRSKVHMKRVSVLITVAVFLGVAFNIHSRFYPHTGVVEAARIQAPIFVVDPYWPKPLPNHWITGAVVGLSIDSNDNVWIIHRASWIDPNFKAADLKLGECCKTAPPVLVYDQAGNLVKSWGGPGEGYHWPDSEHGITVDHKGDVWIGGNGNKDTQILKFTTTASS